VQEGILLGFVETVDFVDEEDARQLPEPEVLARAVQDFADIFDAGGDGAELGEVGLGMGGDETGERGLADPRGAPEDHRREAVPLDQDAERFAGAEEMLLTHERFQG
jgi:hypothetical protein